MFELLKKKYAHWGLHVFSPEVWLLTVTENSVEGHFFCLLVLVCVWQRLHFPALKTCRVWKLWKMVFIWFIKSILVRIKSKYVNRQLFSVINTKQNSATKMLFDRRRKRVTHTFQVNSRTHPAIKSFYCLSILFKVHLERRERILQEERFITFLKFRFSKQFYFFGNS